MDMKTLGIDNKDSVTTVTLNRPDVHNAFNEELMQELTLTFTKIRECPDTRVVVLTAAGKSFCAGGDLNYMKSAAAKDHKQNVDESLMMARMFQSIDTCPRPVVGMVHGAVFGGGVGLVSVCDVVIAQEDSKFCFSEVKLGLTPSVISPFVLKKIPAGEARRYFLTAERFDATEAKRLGLVHHIVSEESKNDCLTNTTNALKQNGPQAIDQAKVLLERNLELQGQELTDFTAEHIATVREGSEAKEGMAAFFEKRKPTWGTS